MKITSKFKTVENKKKSAKMSDEAINDKVKT